MASSTVSSSMMGFTLVAAMLFTAHVVWRAEARRANVIKISESELSEPNFGDDQMMTGVKSPVDSCIAAMEQIDGFDKGSCARFVKGWTENPNKKKGWSLNDPQKKAIEEFFKKAEQVLSNTLADGTEPADTAYGDNFYGDDLKEEKKLSEFHVAMDMATLMGTTGNDFHAAKDMTVSQFWSKKMGCTFAEELPAFSACTKANHCGEGEHGAFNFAAFHFWAASSNMMRALGGDSSLYAKAVVPAQEVGNKPEDSLRIVTISDTHLFQGRYPPLPAGDILIHAGDLFYESVRPPMTTVMDKTKADLAAWFGNICGNYKHIIVVGGNHDAPLQNGDNVKYDGNVVAELKADCPTMTFLANEAVVFTLPGGKKRLRIWGTPVSSDKKLGGNKAFQYLETSTDKKTGKTAMLKDYQAAVESKSVSIFVTHGPFVGTQSAEQSGAAKGAFPTAKDSGAVLHVFGHWHDLEENLAPLTTCKKVPCPMSWVNPALLNRINAPENPGYTIDIPYAKLPDVPEKDAMDNGPAIDLEKDEATKTKKKKKSKKTLQAEAMKRLSKPRNARV